MLAARLQSFEDMFNHGGAELAERIARDSTTLGNLITRHLGEFDRTVKTYGGEMVERLGERTQEVIDRDARLPRQLRHPRQHQGGRSHRPASTSSSSASRTRSTAAPRRSTRRSARRVMDIAKTLAEGGKEVVAALDKRISDVTAVINVRGAKLADALGAKIDDIDKALGTRAMEVADNLDTRIGRFEELLIGRAEEVTKEIETRSKAAADVSTRAWSSSPPRSRPTPARPSRRSPQLTASSIETIGSRIEQMSQAIKTNTGEAERAIGTLATTTTTVINARLEQLSAVDQDQRRRSRAQRSRSLRTSTTDRDPRERAGSRAQPHRHVDRREQRAQAERQRGRAHAARRQRRGRAQLRRQGRRDHHRGQRTRSAEMTRILDDKSSDAAHRAHRQEPGVRQRGQPRHRARGEGDRSQGLHLHADHDGQQRAHRPPDQRGERERDQRADPHDAGGQLRHPDGDRRLHRRRSSRSLKELQDGTDAAAKSAAATIAKTLRDLHEQTHAAVEQSKQTAPAAVSEMLETHSMLRSDTTALFERLREANILLQEVLSGAHENMSEIESTLVTRVSEFVTAMNEVAAEDRRRQHPGRAAHQRVPHRHHARR